jgi:hypothetical protein
MTENFIIFDTELLPAEMKDVFSKFLQAHPEHLDFKQCTIHRRIQTSYEYGRIVPVMQQRFERKSDHFIAFWFNEGDILPEFTEEKLSVLELLKTGIITKRIVKRMNKWAEPPFKEIVIPSTRSKDEVLKDRFISIFHLFQMLIVESEHAERRH